MKGFLCKAFGVKCYFARCLCVVFMCKDAWCEVSMQSVLYKVFLVRSLSEQTVLDKVYGIKWFGVKCR